MKKIYSLSFFMFSGLIIILFFTNALTHANAKELTIEDDNLLVFIEMDDINIRYATDKTSSILIDPTNGVLARVEYLVKGDQKVEIDTIKTIFVLTEVDLLSTTDRVEASLSPKDNFTFIQTWKFNNYVGSKNVKIITGIYSVRYDLHYEVDDQAKILKAPSFYVKFSGNPLTSVFGIVSTIAVAITAFSFYRLLNSLRKSISQEVNKSIESTKIAPTKKLMGYYKGKSYSMLQGEVANAVYGHLTSFRRNDKCPQCESDWPKDEIECPKCMISREEAKELYTKSLVDKTLDSSKEIVDSVSGLSLSNIVSSLAEDDIPTMSIMSVMTFSGLTLIQPRVSKEWRDKTRKLIFTGLRTTIYTLFWIQACGIGTLSLVMLIVAILSGFLIPVLTSKIMGDGIRAKASDYWQSKLSITNIISPK